MKWIFEKTAMWLALTVLLAAMTFAAAQELPEGDGRKLLQDRCVACHSLEPVVSLRLNHDAWKEMTVRMVGYGAQMSDKEVDVTVDYLAKYFGPQASAASGSQAASDEKTALRFIEGVCASCHDSAFIKETRATREEWLEIVKKMNGKGSGLSDRDVELLTDYLAKTYPK